MEYRAIRQDPNDELKHWKYIKRVKGKNGKWRYIYNDQADRKYKIGLTEDTTDKIANHTFKERKRYKQYDGLFDKTEGINWINTGRDYANEEYEWYKSTTHYQGKLSRAVAKGEKWIFDNLISKKRKL